MPLQARMMLLQGVMQADHVQDGPVMHIGITITGELLDQHRGAHLDFVERGHQPVYNVVITPPPHPCPVGTANGSGQSR